MQNIYGTRWDELLINDRKNAKGSGAESGKKDGFSNLERSEFQKDYDRIIYSRNFRRLWKKTQVHPFSPNDHINNRLSHSLQVSTIARSLARKLALFVNANDDAVYENDDRKKLKECERLICFGEIAQAAALAHDIGNPPFGHSGEDAVKGWFAKNTGKPFLALLNDDEKNDFLNFDGNAQGFRILAHGLDAPEDGDGTLPSYTTIAAIVKYPYQEQKEKKEGENGKKPQSKTKLNIFATERQFYRDTFRKLKLQNAEGQYIRHPLSYMMEYADDIAYRIADIEDAVELRILTVEDVQKVLDAIWENLDIDEKKLGALHTDLEKVGYIRAKVISYLIEAFYDSLDESVYAELMTGKIKEIKSIQNENIRRYFTEAKKVFEEKILKSPEKTAYEVGAYKIYEVLLDAFIPAVCRLVDKEKGLPKREGMEEYSSYDEHILDFMGKDKPNPHKGHYHAYHCVIDYISGMTDNYAQNVYKAIIGVR